MSQEGMEQQAEQLDEFDELDAGFEMGMEEESQQPETGDKGQPESKQEATQDGQPENAEQTAPFEQVEQPPVNTSPAQSAQPDQDQQPETKRLEAVPENISIEWEQLRKLNPQAAELAMEDNAEGEAIRSRLSNLGAEAAQDRAEMVLDKRRAAIEENEVRQAQMEAYNRRYWETIKSRNPDYFSLVTDPKRKAEAEQYFKNVQEWIEAKPFREARQLIPIAQRGSAEQVLGLIQQFENEKGKRRADPTGALAVPGRGAPTVPTGIGDKDDFEAGWNLNKD